MVALAAAVAGCGNHAGNGNCGATCDLGAGGSGGGSGGCNDVCDLGGGGGGGGGGSPDLSSPSNPCGMTSCPGGTVDTCTTPTSCGACGHDCLGGTCSDGACQPLPFADSQTNPYGVAVYNGVVYWTDTSMQPTGTVMMRPADVSAAASMIASAQWGPQDIVANAQGVYWNDFYGGEVRTVPLGGGGSPALAASTSGQIGHFAVDAVNVYYTETDLPTSIFKVALGSGGGGGTAFAQGAALQPAALVSDGGKLVWSNTAPGTVLAAPIGDGAQQSTLAGAQSSPTLVAVDATNVYFATPHAIMQAHRDGTGTPSALVSGLPNAPTAMTVDATAIYWTDSAAGIVARAPLATGAPSTLASQQSGPHGVAVDGSWVYWANFVGGTIARVAK
jgi:hypothetical protein